MLHFLDQFNAVIGVLLFSAYLYQVFYTLYGLVVCPRDRRKAKRPNSTPSRRYAALICARNEEHVIGELVASLRAQDYPAELLDIYVLADNSTDGTARAARQAGATVFERFNPHQVGKGYALDELISHIRMRRPLSDYDAFLVFDADNIVDPHFVSAMDQTFAQGCDVLTSYRNSVNLSDNWVSSGSALWFIRESRFVSASRMWLGNSCHVGGTGFMFSQEIMRRNNGWKFHLLTEDLEFTMDSVLHGDRIGYCGTAILYDEQPVTFAQSWRQRLRWSKGFLQVFRYYGPALIKRAVRERDFSAVDFTLLLCPFTVLGIARVLLGMLFAACGFVTWQSQLNSLTGWTSGIVISVIGMMGLAALTIVAERDHVGATNKELLAYVLAFPIYMLSYVPISFQAVFAKSEWKPIEHKG